MKWWARNFLFAEFILAAAIAVAFSVWSYRFGGLEVVSETIKDNRAAVYGALASILGSLLGFAITAESIVLGLSGSPELSLIRDSDHYATLWKVFISAIRSLSLATAIAIVGLILDRESHPQFAILIANVFAASLATLRILRCIWVLENIVGVVSSPSKARKPGE